MTDITLTEDESSRISWAATLFGAAREDLLRSICQVKSVLFAQPAMIGTMRAQLAGGFDEDGKAVRAIFLMASTAMAGFALSFPTGLGTAIAGFLEGVGVAVAASTLSILIVVVAVIVLLVAVPRLPAALRSLAKLDVPTS